MEDGGLTEDEAEAAIDVLGSDIEDYIEDVPN